MPLSSTTEDRPDGVGGFGWSGGFDSFGGSADEGYHGAPVKLLFCFCGSLLCLYLSAWPPLALLALVTSARAVRRVGFVLMLKIYLALAVILAVCLLGVKYLPSLSSFQMARGRPGPGLTFTVIPALRMTVTANLTMCLVMTTPTAALSRLLSAFIRPDWLFIPLTVVLRFVATFLTELTLVREALTARMRTSLGHLALTRPHLLWRGFLVPMTFRTLGGADDLAVNLEIRGLRRRALIWPRPGLFSKFDVPALILGALTLAACLVLNSAPARGRIIEAVGRVIPAAASLWS
ncbi:MAG: energy-coupling factor transporter transmembrane protein EcfT [Deltaproteobacteria bacterium]|jgi:energy-coupling factor transport system permease protein|nr:energy-coupling factor transporter transmembrane protein EcfT [Deltaproteobacteria bacterium]